VQDLDREYGVRESRPAHAAPPRTASAQVRTPLRKAIELLMLRPDLHCLVDRNDLVAARGASRIKPDELALLEALLEVFAESTTTKIGEYFRGSDLERLAREIEVTLLSLPGGEFSGRRAQRAVSPRLGKSQTCDRRGVKGNEAQNSSGETETLAQRNSLNIKRCSNPRERDWSSDQRFFRI